MSNPNGQPTEPVRAALVDPDTSQVANVILVRLEDVASGAYEPPEGLTLTPVGDALIGPGWTYDKYGHHVAPDDAE